MSSLNGGFEVRTGSECRKVTYGTVAVAHEDLDILEPGGRGGSRGKRRRSGRVGRDDGRARSGRSRNVRAGQVRGAVQRLRHALRFTCPRTAIGLKRLTAAARFLVVARRICKMAVVNVGVVSRWAEPGASTDKGVRRDARDCTRAGSRGEIASLERGALTALGLADSAASSEVSLLLAPALCVFAEAARS